MLVPQYLKEKNFSAYYKLVTLAVLFISLLPELLAVGSVIILFLVYLVDNFVHSRTVRMGKTGIAITLYTLLCLASITWARIKIDAAYCGFVWLCSLAVYLIIFNHTDTKEKVENIVLCLVGSAAANSFVGIVQMSFMAVGKPDVIPSPLYEKLDLRFAEFTNYPIFNEFTYDRVSGCFSNPLALSAFLVIAFPLAVFSCYYSPTKKRRVFSILSALLIFFGLLFTFLRGTVVAVVLSLMMLSFAGRKPAKLMSALVAFSSLAMLIVIFSRRGITANQDISTNYRIELWKTCVHGIFANPFGVGAGSENVRRLLFADGQYFESAHNLIIEVALELGIIGMLIFAVALIIVLQHLWRIYHCGGWYKRYAVAFTASLIGFFAMSMFEHTLCYPKEIIYFVIILGCIEATDKIARRNIRYTRG